MKRFYSKKYNKTVNMLRAGEYCVSDDGVILHTILGSCIAACIYDQEKKIGGMNHYLLPGIIRSDEILISKVGRYGMYAMELLISELIKFGAKRKNLAAKVFGGGNVLEFRKSDGDVTGSNIKFARKYLELEGIPIQNEDLGGNKGRKIMFFTDTAKVMLKRFDMKKEMQIFNEEKAYKSLICQRRKADSDSSIILF